MIFIGTFPGRIKMTTQKCEGSNDCTVCEMRINLWLWVRARTVIMQMLHIHVRRHMTLECTNIHTG